GIRWGGKPRGGFRGLHGRAHCRGCGPGDHANRGNHLGAGADPRLHDYLISPLRGDRTMESTPARELGAGMFILLGFASLFFLATQTTNVESYVSEKGYTVTA